MGVVARLAFTQARQEVTATEVISPDTPCGEAGRNCGVEKDLSGQIMATSDNLGPQKVAFSEGNRLIWGKSRLVKYHFIWPDRMFVGLVDVFLHFQPLGLPPPEV